MLPKGYKTNTETMRKHNKKVWKYTSVNSTAPSLHATIKLHKPNTPIRQHATIHKVYYREITTRKNQLFRHYNTPQGQKIRIFNIEKTYTD
jgi:hypothetical protein